MGQEAIDTAMKIATNTRQECECIGMRMGGS